MHSPVGTIHDLGAEHKQGRMSDWRTSAYCLANILRKRGLLTDAEASAMYESMSLPLGLPKYAENPEVQDLQANLDRLFAVVMEPE